MDENKVTADAKNLFQRLLNFDVMIGGTLIKIIYYVGLVGIALYAIVILLAGLGAASYSPLAALAGIAGAAAMLTIGTIFWRFTCEMWMLLFKIYDRLGEIRDRS